MRVFDRCGSSTDMLMAEAEIRKSVGIVARAKDLALLLSRE
jgi:hypothetical protein